MTVLKRWFQVLRNFWSISKTRKSSILQVLRINLKSKTWFKTYLNLISTSLKFQNKTKNQLLQHQQLLRNEEVVNPFQMKIFKWRFERWVNVDPQRIKVSKKRQNVRALHRQVEFQNRVLNENNQETFILDDWKIRRKNLTEKKSPNNLLI